MELYRNKSGEVCTFFTIKHQITTTVLENAIQEMLFLEEKITKRSVIKHVRNVLERRGIMYLHYHIPESYEDQGRTQAIAAAKRLFHEFYPPSNTTYETEYPPEAGN